MEEKTSNTTQNSLADYHQNHTIIFPVDYTTRLDKIKCSVHIEESISVPSLFVFSLTLSHFNFFNTYRGSDNQPLPMTHSTKSVFCTIHAPSVMCRYFNYSICLSKLSVQPHTSLSIEGGGDREKAKKRQYQAHLHGQRQPKTLLHLACYNSSFRGGHW